MKTNQSRLIGMAVLAIVLSAAAPICLAGARHNENPVIVPIGARYAGQTYADLLATYWQWALGVPCPENPNACGTGSISDIQPQQVSLLPMVFATGSGQPVTLQATVPAGKGLFAHLWSWEYDNFLCVGPPPTSYSPKELRKLAIDYGIKAIDRPCGKLLSADKTD